LATGVRVGLLRDVELDDWSRLVSSSPQGSVYALPRYLDALCHAAGGRYIVLGARQGEELIGGLALYECDSLYGRLVAPRLLLYYNGPVLRPYATRYPSEQTARSLKTLAALEQAARARLYGRLTLACSPGFTDARPFLAAGWSAAPRYTYVVDIADPARQWARVEQNLRRLIQRCERDGLSCVIDGDFDAFLALHERTVARKSLELYLPAARFAQYFDALRRQGLCQLFHARQPDGRAVASQLVLLGPGGLCHVVAAAADEAFLRSGASAFLRWKSLEALSAAGYTAADLTDASINPVTHFKSQLGGDLRMLLVLDAPRSLPYRIGVPAGAAYRKARAFLSRASRHVNPGRSRTSR
jgi:hypothetical protein